MITLEEAREILAKEYHIDNFTYLVKDLLLPDFVGDKHSVEFNNTIFTSVVQLGYSSDCNLSVFEVILGDDAQNRRVAITQEMFKILRGLRVNNAVVAFANSDKRNYRISLLTSKYEYNGEKIVKVLSNPRRYSYSLGVGTKTKTAYKFLIAKGKVADLDDLINRFSVEVVNKQFYSEIATSFTELVGGERDGETYEKLLNLYGTVEHNKYAEFGVRLIGRIMFCWFLREKRSENNIPLVPDDMLSLETISDKTNYYHDVLEPLFFELLNTPHKKRKDCFNTDYYKLIPYLNGGLFSPHTDDRYKFDFASHCGQYGVVTIPNEWFEKLYRTLGQYNFTVDENTAYDIELSIDPEMLGRIFENLLAEINPETGENAKKSTGSFYTPRDIVDYMVDSSLCEYLKTKTGIEEIKLNALISYSKEDDDLAVFDATEKKKLIDALYTVTVLDPACGSGAFPIGMLQKVVYVLQELDHDANLWFDKISLGSDYLLREELKRKKEDGSFNYLRKLGVIRNSIFGIDIQPIAVEISRLRCFLSLIIEEKVDDNDPKGNRGINPLPNLDFKFIIANSLIKLPDNSRDKNFVSGQLSLLENKDHISQLKAVREEYFSANDINDKNELKFQFANIQKRMFQETTDKYSKMPSERYRALSNWSPFENEPTSWFDPEWMFGIKDGFDIVIGNPPYIQLQKAISENSKTKLGDLYQGCGFETFAKTGDIYCLFYEKGCALLKKGGVLTYITSNKWMRAAYGENLRQFFAKKTNPLLLIDFAGCKIFDSATVDVNILSFEKSANNGKTLACIAQEDCRDNLSVYVKQNGISSRFEQSNSWTILSPIEQSISDKIHKFGTPLSEWNIEIYRGVLTGLNEAFIISGQKRRELIEADPKSAEIIRPILRGRDVKRFSYDFADLWLIATFPSKNYDIDQYPAVKNHLLSFGYDRLKQSGDVVEINGEKIKARKKTTNKWFETQDTISYWDDFSKPKIVWSRLSRISKEDFSDFPRFCLVKENIVVLDSLCFFVGDNLELLVKVLNSKFASYYFFNSVAILDNGGMQMRQQFVENIPIPDIDLSEKTDQDEIDKLIFSAFELTDTEIRYIDDYLAIKQREIQG